VDNPVKINLKTKKDTSNKMTNIIKKLQRGVVYFCKEILWKPNDPRQDVVVDHLNRYWLTLRDLNWGLDKDGDEEFPLSAGRFPEIMLKDSRLSDVILSSIDRFETKRLPYNDETREELRHQVSQDIAKYLSDNPETFRRICEKDGFYREQKDEL
jgi:hypothetical protein